MIETNLTHSVALGTHLYNLLSHGGTFPWEVRRERNPHTGFQREGTYLVLFDGKTELIRIYAGATPRDTDTDLQIESHSSGIVSTCKIFILGKSLGSLGFFGSDVVTAAQDRVVAVKRQKKVREEADKEDLCKEALVGLQSFPRFNDE